MSIGFIFWLLMLLSLLGWGWGRPWATGPGIAWGSGFLVYVLLFLLGWRVFGFIITG